MIIFDGHQLAQEKEQQLRRQVMVLKREGQQLKLAALYFSQDQASQLYTRIKAEAAQQVGIKHQAFAFSMLDGTSALEVKIAELNQDDTVTGIMIQKPRCKTWVAVKGVNQARGRKAVRQAFNAWWRFLTSRIEITKDVDGLHPQTLEAIKQGVWQQRGLVLPATAKAVMIILNQAFAQLKISKDQQRQLQFLILGRSDIVGLPVFYELRKQEYQVKLLTRDDVTQRLNSSKKLTDGAVIITATGRHYLITADMIQSGVIVIDVGEPQPDVDMAGMKKKAAFITPVPGGVGPMTVMSLLENCVTMGA